VTSEQLMCDMFIPVGTLYSRDWICILVKIHFSFQLRSLEMYVNLTAQDLQSSARIIVGFHLFSDGLKDPANALTIYSVSLDFLKLTAGL